VVESVAFLEAQLELLPSARDAIPIMLAELGGWSLQPPSREDNPVINPELTGSVDPPMPPGTGPEPPLSQDDLDIECPICCDKPKQVILNCSGCHSFCGHCPSEIFKRTARCPLCRDYFNSMTPLDGVAIMEILPLSDRCSILPEFELFEPIEIDPNQNSNSDINEPFNPSPPHEIWNDDDDAPVFGIFGNQVRPNILHNFTSPINDQVRCLGCGVMLNNTSRSMMRHSRRCPVLLWDYI